MNALIKDQQRHTTALETERRAILVTRGDCVQRDALAH